MKTNVQETSRDAYHGEIKPTLGKRQLMVLDAFKYGAVFTNTELAGRLGLPMERAFTNEE